MHNVFHGVKYQLEIQHFSAINFASNEKHFFFWGGWGVGRESQSQQCKQLPWTQLLVEMDKQYILTSLRDMQQTFDLQFRSQYFK